MVFKKRVCEGVFVGGRQGEIEGEERGAGRGKERAHECVHVSKCTRLAIDLNCSGSERKVLGNFFSSLQYFYIFQIF